MCAERLFTNRPDSNVSQGRGPWCGMLLILPISLEKGKHVKKMSLPTRQPRREHRPLLPFQCDAHAAVAQREMFTQQRNSCQHSCIEQRLPGRFVVAPTFARDLDPRNRQFSKDGRAAF